VPQASDAIDVNRGLDVENHSDLQVIVRSGVQSRQRVVVDDSKADPMPRGVLKLATEPLTL
jgi:hypothetical protein